MHQIRLDPTGGAYSAPPDPLAGFKGLLLREGEGNTREGRGRNGRGKGWDWKGGKWKGEKGRGAKGGFQKSPPLKNPRSATVMP